MNSRAKVQGGTLGGREGWESVWSGASVMDEVERIGSLGSCF